MDEVKYPVKYALLPVKARRMNNRGEEFFIDECYIISKAYVIEEHRKYLEDGTYSVNYQIVFPYEVYTEGINLEERIPRLHSTKQYESLAFYLFDSYEEAQEAKEKKNVLISNEVVEKYQPYEDRIQELTKDMVVGNENKDFKNKIKSIQQLLLEKREEELSYEDVLMLLGFSMNADDFGVEFLIREYEKGETISREALSERFLEKTSMDELLTLYDFLNNMGDLEKNNQPNIKKKVRT